MEKYMKYFGYSEISQFTLRFLLKKLNCGFFLPFPLKKQTSHKNANNQLFNLESSYIHTSYLFSRKTNRFDEIFQKYIYII